MFPVWMERVQSRDATGGAESPQNCSWEQGQVIIMEWLGWEGTLKLTSLQALPRTGTPCPRAGGSELLHTSSDRLCFCSLGLLGCWRSLELKSGLQQCDQAHREGGHGIPAALQAGQKAQRTPWLVSSNCGVIPNLEVLEKPHLSLSNSSFLPLHLLLSLQQNHLAQPLLSLQQFPSSLLCWTGLSKLCLPSGAPLCSPAVCL